MTRDAFISYSNADAEPAEQIRQALESRGVKCWIAPRDIPAGQTWASAIVTGIEESHVVVVLISAAANHSRQMPREVEIADAKHRGVLPVRIENVALASDLEFFLGNRQWIDVFPGPIMAHADRLAAAVASLRVTPPPLQSHPMAPSLSAASLSAARPGRLPGASAYQPYAQPTPAFMPPAFMPMAGPQAPPRPSAPGSVRRILPWALAILVLIAVVGTAVSVIASQEQARQREEQEFTRKQQTLARQAEEALRAERDEAKREATAAKHRADVAAQHQADVAAQHQAEQRAAAQERYQIMQTAGVSPASLTETQQIAFVANLKSSRCLCGCRYGSFLACLREDSACPRRASNVASALMAAR
jgi:hypothetical protein